MPSESTACEIRILQKVERTQVLGWHRVFGAKRTNLHENYDYPGFGHVLQDGRSDKDVIAEICSRVVEQSAAMAGRELA